MASLTKLRTTIPYSYLFCRQNSVAGKLAVGCTVFSEPTTGYHMALCLNKYHYDTIVISQTPKGLHFTEYWLLCPIFWPYLSHFANLERKQGSKGRISAETKLSVYLVYSFVLQVNRMFVICKFWKMLTLRTQMFMSISNYIFDGSLEKKIVAKILHETRGHMAVAWVMIIIFLFRWFVSFRYFHGASPENSTRNWD